MIWYPLFKRAAECIHCCRSVHSGLIWQQKTLCGHLQKKPYPNVITKPAIVKRKTHLSLCLSYSTAVNNAFRLQSSFRYNWPMMVHRSFWFLVRVPSARFAGQADRRCRRERSLIRTRWTAPRTNQSPPVWLLHENTVLTVLYRTCSRNNRM